MRRTGLLALLPLLFTLGCASLPALVTRPDDAPRVLLFQGVRVFDGERELPGPQDVLVRSGKIAFVGPAGTLPAPKAAHIIDGTDRTLLPGLWDSHVHLGGSNGEAPWDQRLPDVKRQLQTLVFAGVTTAVDAGHSVDLRRFGRKIRAGKLLGPHLIEFSRLFTKKDGHPAPLFRALAPWPLAGIAIHRSIRQIDSTDEVARAMEKELADTDTPFVKIIYNAIPPKSPHLTRAELAALIEAAHAGGRRVGVHVGTPREAREAVAAGADLLMHTPWTAELSDADLAALAKFDRPILTTRRIYGVTADGLNGKLMLSDLERSVMDPERLARLGSKPEGYGEEIFDKGYLAALPRWDRFLGANVRRVRAAGIPQLVGTDSGLPGLFQGPALHRELEALVALGFEPVEVLRLATSAPADFFEPKGMRGRIQKGTIADLLLVEGNPLQWITDTQRVVRVFVGGVPLDRHPANLRDPDEKRPVARR